MTLPANVGVAAGASIGHEDQNLLYGFFRFAEANPGHRFTITSGDRSSQPASGVGGNVAPEGLSNHELYATGRAPYDEAIDVTVDGQYLGNTSLAADLARFGLHLPVKTDPVHVTLLGVNG